LEEVLDAIVHHANEIMSADFCVLFPYERKKHVFKKGIWVPSEINVELAVPNSDGYTASIAQKQKPRFAKDGRNEPGRKPRLPEDKEILSFACVPLVARQNTVGVLYVNYLTPHDFSEDEEEIIQLLCNQAAVALENARLLRQEQQLREQEKTLREKEQQKSAQLAALQDIGVKITAQLDLNDVLSAIAEYANQVVSADFSTLFPYDSEKDQFGPGIRKGKVDVEPSIPSNTGYTARLAKSQKAVFVRDAESEPGVKASFSTAKGVKSYAGIPLVIKSKTVGVLYVNFLEPHIFAKEEQELVQLLANQAAVALENARFYTHMEQLVNEKTRQVIDAERLAAIGSVAGELVHKMNNLAGTIPGRVRLIKEKLDPQDLRDQRIDTILKGILADSLRLLEEARRIRESTAPEAETQEDANALLQLALARARRAFREMFESGKIKVIEQYVASPIGVKIQRNPLTNALENMIRNAIEAMPDGGTLTLKTEIEGDKVSLYICDTGRGIDVSVMSKLFDPFYTTKSNGMGFGLWQARTVIRSVGGDIQVESLPDKGAIFIVKLPLFSASGSGGALKEVSQGGGK
jgi:GAF domain-containing protein